jgi:hypothetical protein
MRSPPLVCVSGGMKGAEWPRLKDKEEKLMQSIKLTFNRAATVNSGISIFALLLLAIAIDDDRQKCEKDRREKRERASKPHRKRGHPLRGPRPW